jgi:hypothetical protein
MIYIINSNQLSIAIQNDCQVLLLSSDSTQAMIKGTNLDNLTVLSSHQPSEMNALYSNPFWKQPCKDCENV